MASISILSSPWPVKIITIAEAIANGAAAVLWEAGAAGSAAFIWRSEWRIANLPVNGLRELCGPLAHAVWGRPSERLSLVAVTGTNGKTTVTHWIGMTHPRPCAIIGTLGAGLPGQLVETGFTTPAATTLMRYLAAFAHGGSPGLCARGEFNRDCRRTPRRGSD